MITFNNTFLNNNIIQNGLNYDFDPSIEQSYPSPKTGTSVFDLSGNGRTTTLGAPITYNTNNQGVFDFNTGTASFIYSIINNATITMGVWVKFTNASNAFRNIFGVIAADGIAFCTGNGSGGIGTRVHMHFGNVTFGPVTGFHTIVAGNWVHFTFTRAGGLNSFYVNGVLNSTGNVANYGASNAGNFGGSTIGVQIGKAYLYTKGLTAQEVLFNHNVTKERFGL